MKRGKIQVLIKDRTLGSKKPAFGWKKMSAPVLKCSHILTNRQRREIITYKKQATRDHLIRVIQLGLAVQIFGSGVL